MAFVNHIADLAEQQNHHPDIDIRYNKVRLGLITHDAQGITQRDAKLAHLVDSLPTAQS
jgi:4a-hydroxytetrahydrobiopterin dehydratase